MLTSDVETERMIVTQDVQTTYDLGRNPTEIKVYDNNSWAYTEMRTYAKGYQLTGFSTSEAADVTVNTSGSFTYDTNNNMTDTKELDASRNGTQLAYRAKWKFTYDRKNRLISHTHLNAGDVRGNLWYDGMGRVWQRWNDNSSTSYWADTLKRFVYDGGALFQEHQFDVAEVESEWVYTYDQILYDYLRQPGGIRQRDISTVDQSETDRFLLSDKGQITARIERETSSVAQRMELSASGARQAGGSEQDVQISNLATSGSYIESFGGGTGSGSTQFFDPLQQIGTRHYLAGLDRFLTRLKNQPYTMPAQVMGAKLQDDAVTGAMGYEYPPPEVRTCFICHDCRADNCYWPGPRCWAGRPDDEDYGSCSCEQRAVDCRGCTAEGEHGGIQCPNDSVDCWDVMKGGPEHNFGQDPNTYCVLDTGGPCDYLESWLGWDGFDIKDFLVLPGLQWVELYGIY